MPNCMEQYAPCWLSVRSVFVQTRKALLVRHPQFLPEDLMTFSKASGLGKTLESHHWVDMGLTRRAASHECRQLAHPNSCSWSRGALKTNSHSEECVEFPLDRMIRNNTKQRLELKVNSSECRYSLISSSGSVAIFGHIFVPIQDEKW